MTGDEAMECLRLYSELWPRAKRSVTDEQIRQWRAFLMRYPFHDVQAAMRSAFQTAKYPPQPADLRERLAQPAAAGEVAEQPVGVSSVSVVCIEAIESMPHRLGMALPLVWGRASEIPDDHEMARVAEIKRERCERIYGGRWQVQWGGQTVAPTFEASDNYADAFYANQAQEPTQ